MALPPCKHPTPYTVNEGNMRVTYCSTCGHEVARHYVR